MLLFKALTLWLAILALAVINGALREALLVPLLGPTTGLLLSGAFLSVMVLVATYLALPWLRVRQPAQLIAIGFGWLLLTVLFELAFGLYQGKSLHFLFEAYTFQGGNVWPVVLLVTAIAPYVASPLRGRRG